MKNIFPPFILFFLLSFNFISAQNPYTQIFTISLEDPQCYPFADYPTRFKVTKKFLSDYLGFNACPTDCTFPSYKGCKAILINTDALEKTPPNWCFYGALEFGWLCQDPPNGEEGKGGEGKKKEEDESSNRAAQPDKSFATIIQAATPNPSSGNSYMEINLRQAPSIVEMIINDWTGKLIQQHKYKTNSSANLGLPIDLSEASNGIYFVSIKVNGVIVKTDKLLIQR